MRGSFCLGALALTAIAGSAFGGVSDIDSVQLVNRIYNDFPNTNLTVTDNYPTSVRYQETDFPGTAFANKHAAWLSADNGASAYDFNYGDTFDFQVTVNDNSTGVGQVEAGINADLFGFGFFGGLPSNGEIAAFGSTFPFHSFGTGLYAAGDTLDLRMTYKAGAAEFIDPSMIRYMYQVNGGGWVSSGWIPFTNGEMGWPSGIPDTQFYQKIGFGVQFDNPTAAAVADVTFSNILVTPTPGAAALFGLAGLAGIRRRR